MAREYLHLFDLAQVRVATICEEASCFLQLCLDLHALVVEDTELRLKTLVLGRFNNHFLGQSRQLCESNKKYSCNTPY